MIDYMNFKKLDNIEFAELTNNTIILFNDKKMLYEFKMEIELGIIGDENYEYVDYATEKDNEEISIEVLASNPSMGIYDVNNGQQRIIATIEATSILLAQSLKDLWFVDITNDEEWDCYALTHFEDTERYKNDNIKLYKAVCQGKFGCCDKEYKEDTFR